MRKEIVKRTRPNKELGELKFIERLITETYPTGIVSIVSDTFDLWKVLTDYLPAMKDEILARDGKLVIRPDSGDPVDILCGKFKYNLFEDIEEYGDTLEEAINEYIKDGPVFKTHDQTEVDYLKFDNKYYIVNSKAGRCIEARWDGSIFETKLDYYQEVFDNTPSDKGVIELLWDVFGGTINDKGYKVLDPHIGAIYGDSITLERCQQICERLEKKGFASTNVVFGIGSYTYTYNTRDTFGFAMKATWCQVNGKRYNIFKDPVTDDGTKKSAKGLIRVDRNVLTGEFEFRDQCKPGGEIFGYLDVVFENGKLVRHETLSEIRNRLMSI